MWSLMGLTSVLNPSFLGIANLLYHILYSTVDCHIVGLLLNNDKLYCVLLCDSSIKLVLLLSLASIVCVDMNPYIIPNPGRS